VIRTPSQFIHSKSFKEASLEDLRYFHTRIAEHLSARHTATGLDRSVVYFADHGLSSDELVGLMTTVKDALHSTSLESFTWTISNLPLIVCAVEVGYGYEGNGTDFWPMLENRLGHSFEIDDRNRISGWFEKASQKFGGVAPGDSEWEQAFCHIAWPITHAVAAKDIRRPFADCLRRFRGSLDGDDSSIVERLANIATPVGSRRYRTWLARPNVVAGIVRDLLGGPKLNESGLFSETFRERLIEDLKREPEIQRAMRSVRSHREKEAAKKERKSASRKKEKSDLRLGDFFLQQDDHGDFALFGELPEMPRTVQTNLRAVRRKWQPKPWGFAGASTLPSDTLRSVRGTFPVEMSYVSRADAEKPFFAALEDLSIDVECAAWLSSIRLPAGEKLAFRPIAAGGDTSHSITSPTPHSGTVWVLTKATCNWPEVSREKVGETSDGELYAVDASDNVLRSWLGWPESRNIQTNDQSSIRWMYPSPISMGADGRRVFTTDDEIGIHVGGDLSVELKLMSEGLELDCQTVDKAALVNIEQPGNYDLMVLSDGKKLESFSFSIIDQKGDGFIEPDPEYPWQCKLTHVDSGVCELTRSDFFNHRLVLDIEADRTIENVHVTVSLNPGSSKAKLFLPRIPARLSAHHPLWIELLQGMPSSVLTSACDLTLAINLANITSEEWRLEPELHSVWWHKNSSGLPKATTDRGEMETIHQCVVTGKQIDDYKHGYPFVSVALDDQKSELIFDGRVSLVGDAQLQVQLERPSRFLRQMDDFGDNPGLRSIARRYLSLASASSDSVVAEINRVGAVQTLREWILTSLCGPNWVAAQKQGAACEAVNPVALWWQVQHRYADLIQPKSEEVRILPSVLPDLMLADFSELLPIGWWDGQLTDIGVDYATSLDAPFKHLLDGEDVYVDADVLTRTLREANNIVCGAHLAEIVIPVTGGDDLMRWGVSECSIKELADSLLDWTRTFLKKGRGRQSWAKEELQAYLNLLIYPEQLRKSSWQSILEKLLHDRPVARAGAFLAWRIEQNLRMSSFIEDLMQLKPMSQVAPQLVLSSGNDDEEIRDESEEEQWH
jgi:hypothetical protein